MIPYFCSQYHVKKDIIVPIYFMSMIDEIRIVSLIETYHGLYCGCTQIISYRIWRNGPSCDRKLRHLPHLSVSTVIRYQSKKRYHLMSHFTWFNYVLFIVNSFKSFTFLKCFNVYPNRMFGKRLIDIFRKILMFFDNKCNLYKISSNWGV